MEWEHQGEWADENMPSVDELTTSFFGWRESGDISLEEAIQNVYEILSGHISWEFEVETLPDRGNSIPLPYVEIYVSIDGGETWKQPTWDSDAGAWEIGGISNESQLRVKAYLRSDFIDILPWEVSKLLKVEIYIFGEESASWVLKDKVETTWTTVQNLNN